MSEAEFPVRVALPADESGWRRDLQGAHVVGPAEPGEDHPVYWGPKDDWLTAACDSVVLPALLKALDILDIPERGKAGAWAGSGEISARPGHFTDPDDLMAGGGVVVAGNRWQVRWEGDVVVATGEASSHTEAKVAADQYAAMLYELDGGAFVVEAVEVAEDARASEWLAWADDLLLNWPSDVTDADMRKALTEAWGAHVRAMSEPTPEAPALPLAGVVLSGRWENPGGCSLCDNELIAVRLDRVALRAGIGFDNGRDNTERGVWSIWVEGRALATGVGNRADAIAAARDLGATVRGGE